MICAAWLVLVVGQHDPQLVQQLDTLYSNFYEKATVNVESAFRISKLRFRNVSEGVSGMSS